MKITNTARRMTLNAVLAAGWMAASAAIAADLRVPADHPTVQAAVDAASNGDVILIASGVYAEQVKIVSKKLTLIGQPGTILRATTNMHYAPASPAHVVPIMEIGTSDVTLQGLTFEGERLAEFYPSPTFGNLEGILSYASSAVVERCAFYGFRKRAAGVEVGNAIVFVNIESGVESVNFRATGNAFADNDAGILVVGSSTRRSVDVTLENNTIIGLGPRATVDGNAGIAIEDGVGGRITGNTISGFSYTGTTAPFPISFGIVASSPEPPFHDLPQLVIEGNTLRENQQHISLIKGNGSVVRNNRFQGTTQGIVPLGLAVSGTNVLIANNQFENLPEGIRLLGDDPLPDELPGLGDLLGFAGDVQVASNRFCNVTKPINLQSPATATETGTQLNACDSRPLAIEPAVLFSWPGDEAGWILESAANVQGPWAASTATAFTQDARNHIALPADSTARFFRLR